MMHIFSSIAARFYSLGRAAGCRPSRFPRLQQNNKKLPKPSLVQAFLEVGDVSSVSIVPNSIISSTDSISKLLDMHYKVNCSIVARLAVITNL